MNEAIVLNSWDSQLLGLSAGYIRKYNKTPDIADLADYGFVAVKIPVTEFAIYEKYVQLGFDFVTVEFSLRKRPSHPLDKSAPFFTIITKQYPNFRVSGFDVAGSRLYLDPRFRAFLPKTYWDKSIVDHCRNFADFCICRINKSNDLQGIVSCFRTQNTLDLHLVAVHPASQSQGIGKSLMLAADGIAKESGLEITTSAVSQNSAALQFYLINGFQIEKAEYVLHYWRN